MKIILKGRVPSKKNSRVISCRGSRPRSFPSKQYQDWHEASSWELKSQRLKPMTGELAITATFYAPDKRKADLSNKFESVADLLVDNGLIEDDNYFVLPEVSIRFGGVDKENPRVELWISSFTNSSHDIL